MNYEVTEVQSGKYDCDTIFIKVEEEIVQVPVSKEAKGTNDLIGKLITIKDLYNVPLDKVVLAKVAIDK